LCHLSIKTHSTRIFKNTGNFQRLVSVVALQVTGKSVETDVPGKHYNLLFVVEVPCEL